MRMLGVGQMETIPQDLMKAAYPMFQTFLSYKEFTDRLQGIAQQVAINSLDNSDELTLKESYKYLKISRTQLHFYCRNGTLEKRYRGGRAFIKKEDLDMIKDNATKTRGRIQSQEKSPQLAGCEPK